MEQISGSLGKNRGSVEEILQERSEILIFFRNIGIPLAMKTVFRYNKNRKDTHAEIA